MRLAAVCVLLVVTLALTSGDNEGTFTVINNGTVYKRAIAVRYKRTGDDLNKEDKSLDILPGENKTIAILNAKLTSYSVTLKNKEPPFGSRSIFWSYFDFVPLKMCVKTWGTEDDPQVGQVDCTNTMRVIASRDDGGAISVQNNATFTLQGILRYEYENDQSKKKHFADVEVKPGEAGTMQIPKGTYRISVWLHDETYGTVTFHLAQPVKLCFRISGPYDVHRATQIDCST